MPLTGQEIRQRLVAFAERWSVYDGSERAEAQTFLNELFECYGTHRVDVARFEEPQEGRFIDAIWPRVCLIEMKRPAEARRLETHRDQAFGYWREAAQPERNIPAPRYLILCAFRRLEVWMPGEYPGAPRVELDLIELPDQYETLLFLAGREGVFTGGHEAITRDAVARVVEVYQSLRERRAADADVLRDFVLQTVWCMFAEDLGQLEAQLFTGLLDRLIAEPHRSSVDEIGQLFVYLNTHGGGPEQGVYARVPYANGGLFARPARVHLDQQELIGLRLAAEYNWTKVQPSIFGSLLEGGLGHDMQWALGAHYTHEADIRKVVGPTIVEPWEQRLASIHTHSEAQQAQNDLMNYVVLDPACGSGNFLYVAYRELRRIEQQLAHREAELRRAAGLPEQHALSLFFPLTNLQGIEINGFALAVARVTLWMAHRQVVGELQLDEATLPLADLSGIRQGDALRLEWPRADAIIGNPPFHGDRHLRELLGGPYVEWLQRRFQAGIKDYCVYWFRKSHDHLETGKRAGLVGTNSISQNRARSESLAYILENDGVITSAVSTQGWPGEANVDVSIVNWVKDPAEEVAPRLDGQVLDEPVWASLRPFSLAVDRAAALPQNEGYAFYGPIPGADGYILEQEEAERLLEAHGEGWRSVIRPYLVGNDILTAQDQAPSRFIIDFGFRELEEAMQFGEALDLVRERAKPQKDRVSRRSYRENWWRFSEPIREMREALEGQERYLAAPAQGQYIPFVWADAWVCPSNLTTVFAFDDDYSLGILTSSTHRSWALAQASTLQNRTRYTTSSTFDTFPWPDPDTGVQAEIGELAAQLHSQRATLCREHEIGLTRLYNLIRDGAFRALAEAHTTLDRAVVRAYGLPERAAAEQDTMNKHLLDLNLAIAGGAADYHGPRGSSA